MLYFLDRRPIQSSNIVQPTIPIFIPSTVLAMGTMELRAIGRSVFEASGTLTFSHSIKTIGYSGRTIVSSMQSIDFTRHTMATSHGIPMFETSTNLPRITPTTKQIPGTKYVCILFDQITTMIYRLRLCEILCVGCV